MSQSVRGAGRRKRSSRNGGARNRISGVMVAPDDAADRDAQGEDTQNDACRGYVSRDSERDGKRGCRMTAGKRIPSHTGTIEYEHVHVPYHG